MHTNQTATITETLQGDASAKEQESAIEQARRTMFLQKVGSPTNKFSHFGQQQSAQKTKTMSYQINGSMTANK